MKKINMSDVVNVILAAAVIILLLTMGAEKTTVPPNESQKKELINPSKEKIVLEANKLVLPTPIILLGTQIKAKPNFMTAAFVGIVNSNPPMLAIGVQDKRFTMKGISEIQSFSVNIPNEQMLTSTDYVGTVSGRDTDKSGVFDVFYGEDPMVPLILEAPVSLECKLVSELEGWENRSHHILIAEITNVHISKNMLTNGKPDMAKMSPIIYSLAERTYFGIGEKIGTHPKASQRFIQKRGK
jgi:flavin reductase (DIM6/NTAB) family NADH-FMN oxidoreductase RutF